MDLARGLPRVHQGHRRDRRKLKAPNETTRGVSEEADEDILLVACADKLHNATAILRDYRLHGDELWERFNATAEDQL